MLMTIPQNLLTKIDILNREDNIPLTTLARKHNVNYSTLYRKLNRYRQEENLHYERVMEKEVLVVDYERKKMWEKYLEVKNRYKVGMKIKVQNTGIKNGAYHIEGNVKVKGIYKDFMLVERQGAEGKVRECVHFRDILCGSTRVEVR